MVGKRHAASTSIDTTKKVVEDMAAKIVGKRDISPLIGVSQISTGIHK